MIGILIAIKSFLEIDAVVGALGAMDAGLNVATLFGILKSRLPKDSMERQMISALDESLKESCRKLGWHYDSMAAYMWLDVETVLTTTAMTKESLKESLEKLTGKDISESNTDVFIDCFDKSVAGKPELFRYLNQKWMRYIGKDNPIPEFIPITLTTISSPVELIGREDDILAIRNTFSQNNVVYLHADGGVGKTAVANRIVNDLKGEIERGNSQFEHVAWITSNGNLKTDLSKLEIPAVEAAGSVDEKFKKACGFLQEHATFLVIDNMDNPPDVDDVNIINTISGSTKILITTRAAIPKFKPYLLKKMDKQDAIILFYKHYLNSYSAPSWQEIDHRPDKDDVEKIIDASTCNALMIELIAKMACWEWVDRLDELWTALEKNVFGIDSDDIIETDHADSHLSVIDKKLQGQIRNLYRISTLNDTQQELMRFFAVFSSEAIIFADTFKWAGFKAADLRYLTERGWIEKARDGFLIHTMVKGSVELQDDSFNLENYENLIVELINTDQYIPDKMVYTQKADRFLVADTICLLLIEKECKKETTASLLNKIASVHRAQGNYEKALDYYKIALAIFKTVLGKEHPATAMTYNNIALVYSTQGYYEKALKYCKKALTIYETVLGKEHPVTAIMYNNIAGVYSEEGKNKKALEYYEKAIAINKTVCGVENPYKATMYNNIATVYSNEGKYEKALGVYKEALEIQVELMGKEHPATAMTYNNMASAYSDYGNYEKALEYYEKAKEILEKALGEENPFTVTTYNNIAGMYKDQGNYKKALEYYEKALIIREKVLGKEHPSTAITYGNLAGVYRIQGNYKKALEYYEKSLIIKKKVLGKAHPSTATTYNNIAVVYHGQSNYEKALEYNEKALIIREKVLGNDHPSTATTYNNLGRVYHSQGNYEKALEYYEKALSIRKKVLGLEHPSTAKTYGCMGELFVDLHNYEEAKNVLQKAYEIYLKMFDSNHFDTIAIKDLLERVNQKLNN